MSDEIIVELNNVFLKSDRGAPVFQDLNFKLVAGRSAVITGAAGSGKSMLAELLVGRRFADQGSVELFGQVVKRSKKRAIKKVRRKTGGIGGIFDLVPSFTVAETIIFPMVLVGERKKVRKERLLNMLTEFSLLKQATERPDRLTRVERTLVQFARASVANQPLIIVDEPLAGLDQKTYERIFEYMIKISCSGRSAIFLSAETLPREIPNSDSYQLINGALV